MSSTGYIDGSGEGQFPLSEGQSGTDSLWELGADTKRLENENDLSGIDELLREVATSTGIILRSVEVRSVYAAKTRRRGRPLHG